MRLVCFVVLSAMAIGSGGVKAQQISGNSLYSACTTDDPSMQGFCVGYLLGQIEGQFWGGLLLFNGLGTPLSPPEFNEIASAAFGHCIPPDAPNSQLRDVAVKYLIENPETRHESARVLVWQAYREAFPCE